MNEELMRAAYLAGDAIINMIETNRSFPDDRRLLVGALLLVTAFFVTDNLEDRIRVFREMALSMAPFMFGEGTADTRVSSIWAESKNTSN